MEPRGILRNKEEGHAAVHDEGDLDRQEVIRNTNFNAHLTDDAAKGEQIRAQIAEAKSHNGKEPDHLKWDEINLYKTEQEKAATMKIDEPKTPYEGGFDPLGEYYQEDDAEAIPAFTLGESEFVPEAAKESLNGGEVIDSPDQDEEEDDEKDEEEILAEERHRRFEEMRKKHYHLAATPLHHKVDIADE